MGASKACPAIVYDHRDRAGRPDHPDRGPDGSYSDQRHGPGKGKDLVVEKVLGIEDTFQAAGLDAGAYYLSARSIDDLGLEGLDAEPAVVRVQRSEYTLIDSIVGIMFVIAAFLI